MASSDGKVKPCNERATYCLYFLGFMDLCVVSMGLPLVTRKARELGATPSIVGLIASIYGGIQLFSSPMIGKFSDVAGRKKVLLIALVCTGMAYFLIGLSESLVVLAITRIPVGIFKQTQGLCKVSLADITPAIERPKVFGYFNSISSLGFVVGPLIGGHIGMTEYGFFKVMALQCVGFVSMAIFSWYYLDIPGTTTRQEITLSRKSSDADTHMIREENINGSKNDDNVKTIYKDSSSNSSIFTKFLTKLETFLSISSLYSIVDLLLLRFVLGFAMIIFRSNFTTMLEFRYHTSPKTNGYIMSFNGMVSGLSGTAVGYVMARYNHNAARAVLHFSILITCALFFITFSPDLWVLVAFLAPLSFSTSVSRVCVSSLTLKRCKQDERGVILGVGNSMLSFARMLSPLLAGFAQEYSVYGPGMISVGIASIGVSIAAFVIH
ncbi:hypothetical protein QZH41_018439 [Actinostola sp. cb2023]|nr:hypothetical protein QZH41_018439 [Actinostola sp. cb2023]